MEAEASDLRGLPSGLSGPEPVRYRTQTELEEIQPLWSFCESGVLSLTNISSLMFCELVLVSSGFVSTPESLRRPRRRPLHGLL